MIIEIDEILQSSFGVYAFGRPGKENPKPGNSVQNATTKSLTNPKSLSTIFFQNQVPKLFVVYRKYTLLAYVEPYEQRQPIHFPACSIFIVESNSKIQIVEMNTAINIYCGLKLFQIALNGTHGWNVYLSLRLIFSPIPHLTTRICSQILNKKKKNLELDLGPFAPE